MIYCFLKGGLGNMLFQIAATKSISLDIGTDFSFPNLYEHLAYLNNEDFYNPSLSHSSDYEKVFKKLPTVKPTNEAKQLNFPFEYVDITLLDSNFIKSDIIINGFFQSEKYFNKHRNKILEMFSISDEITNHIINVYPFILDKKVTSVHVRRGDYLKHPNHHPSQNLDYYTSAIKILEKDTDLFLVFSDDIKWCQENLIGDNFIYISDEIDYIELYLMSLCKNNVISNSSFSWWGAWMNKNINKKVIAPKLWFGSLINENTSDIIPNNWIKI
jgi:hypothetical protein